MVMTDFFEQFRFTMDSFLTFSFHFKTGAGRVHTMNIYKYFMIILIKMFKLWHLLVHIWFIYNAFTLLFRDCIINTWDNMDHLSVNIISLMDSYWKFNATLLFNQKFEIVFTDKNNFKNYQIAFGVFIYVTQCFAQSTSWFQRNTSPLINNVIESMHIIWYCRNWKLRA